MSKYSKYRIIEKDKFFIQKKSWYGWHYHYNIDKVMGILFISALVFIIIGIVHVSVLFFTDYRNNIIPYIIEGLTMLVFLISRFRFKYEFDQMNSAKQFIDNQIKQTEDFIKRNAERKIKRKNKKIHYLDIQTERKEKLNNLNK